MTAQELVAAEKELIDLWRDGEVNGLTHFMGGNEEWLADFFHSNVKPTDWVFASHRCHFHYLLHGGTDLKERVLAGKSMFLYHPRFVCSAIVAGTPGIAAGLALAIQQRGGTERVWSFVGDGAEDEGAFYEAAWFVQERQLPCTFIIEDNDSSCGVSRRQRRGSDKDRTWPECVIRYRYEPRWPHAGDGSRPVLKRTAPV